MNAQAQAEPATTLLRSAPVEPGGGALRPLGLADVRITGGFWAERQDLSRTTVLDHNLDWLGRQGSVENFRAVAAGRIGTDRRGPIFTDSDVYKTVEAIAWEAGQPADAGREDTIAELAGLFDAAQSPDGYLNTAFGHAGQPARYTDLDAGHELYCTGHLIQAGVARARTGHHDQLAEVARRAADQVCDTFGVDGVEGLCGHPGIEMALVELARVTGESRYLEQAALFVHRRGEGILGRSEYGPAYYLDDVSVRRRDVLDGHAVRALYLAAGAVDVAVETDDAELLEAVVRQWEATVARRTYLTGGMGAHHLGEAFGDDFVLPPDRAYSETCAAIASVMLSWRLLLATGEPRYADLIERTLFNVVAASAGADGQSFFYANPLHVRRRGLPPDAAVASQRAATASRAPWFDVPCCPTNLARLLASLAAYFVTTDRRGVQVHQYADTDVTATLEDGSPIGLKISTGYPKHGSVSIAVTEAPSKLWTLTLRVPEWAGEGASLVVPGGGRRPVRPGSVDVTRVFTAGDEIRLELPVAARWVAADPRVDAVRGSLAVERGPIVMCVESTDLPGGHDVDAVLVDAGADPIDRFGSVYVEGQLLDHATTAWPYAAPGAESHRPRASDLTKIPLVPYHSWANRGPSTMRVWMPVAT